MGFWSILEPNMPPKPLKITILNFPGSLFEGVLVPLGAKMGQDGPQTPPKTDFYRFWTPTW